MDDEGQIVGIIAEMFEAISWSHDASPDLSAFKKSVLPDALLVPAARPAVTTGIEAFVSRMAALHAGGSLKSFKERADRTIVKIFGNVAVAIGSFSADVDGSKSRGANGFLLVKDDGRWWIAGLAWDNERDDVLLPEELR